ncbi:hypothetical protein [Bacillus thuringiensis]|uniref:Uncharacterized protein n=1 Tax=Bacillus thuringiensis TaxID=1428 RepID=A0A9X6WSL2_BACTU|nr:hypothetical protein [Bacillus thuringiensis]PFJ42759.1 hypothetical protein COJ15_05305 [Bacillus thuringiensis]
MNNIKDILTNTALLLREELTKENPFTFKPIVIGSTLELENYYEGTFYVTIDTLDKIENRLNVNLRYFTKKRKVVAVKPKKKDYHFFKLYFEIITKALFEIAAAENKTGIVITYSDFDEKLADFLTKCIPDLNPLQYGEEVLNLIEKKGNFGLVGMKLSSDVVKQSLQFIEIIPKLRNIFDKNPLLTFENTYRDGVLCLFNEEVKIRYLGESMNWKLVDNNKIVIHNEEENTQNTILLDEQLIFNYLEELKEEKKLKHLIAKPMDNYEQLIYKLSKVESLSKASKINYFWIKDKQEDGFEKLEEHTGSWETAESVCVELLEKWEKGDYSSYDSVSSHNGNTLSYVFTYEFFHNESYFYFVFINKRDDDNTEDRVQVVISKEKNPTELKMLVFDLLMSK